jgi:hypothetical protein
MEIESELAKIGEELQSVLRAACERAVFRQRGVSSPVSGDVNPLKLSNTNPKTIK